MLISRKWLQTYTSSDLPNTDQLVQTLMLHAFEIEGVETISGDDVIDIDVLPNRAHDCLCHEGVAHELLGLLELPIKEDRYTHFNIPHTSELSVSIEEPERCRRFTAIRVDNVRVEESPSWIQERLTSIEQRSINNIVDLTNYLMFDIGQPMHAFDADKVVGGITVRHAREEETMVTLTGETLILTPNDLVIADDEGILSLAGIKGGTKAEVTEETKNIILEIANFEPTSIRRTSRRVKIQTDSSKRFENELSPNLVSQALQSVTSHVTNLCPESTVIGYIDKYPQVVKPRTVSVPLERIETLLGTSITKETVTQLFTQFNYSFSEDEDNIFVVTIPDRRLDLTIPEDLVEEIGRWYGYHNIETTSIETIVSDPQVDDVTYLTNKIKNFLVQKGYSEVLTYSFVEKGEVTLYNPIASDKQALRASLKDSLGASLQENLKNASYFGTERIRIFEIGRVYHSDGEKIQCAIGVKNVNKKARKQFGEEQEQLTTLQEELTTVLGTLPLVHLEASVLTFSLNTMSKEISTYGTIFTELESYLPDSRYHPISIYPYSNRDISLWVNEGTTPDVVEQCIREYGGEHLKKIYLFDEFTKEGRTSYAYSLIFQSHEKTLADVDVDVSMNAIIQGLTKNNWEVR